MLMLYIMIISEELIRLFVCSLSLPPEEVILSPKKLERSESQQSTQSSKDEKSKIIFYLGI